MNIRQNRILRKIQQRLNPMIYQQTTQVPNILFDKHLPNL